MFGENDVHRHDSALGKDEAQQGIKTPGPLSMSNMSPPQLPSRLWPLLDGTGWELAGEGDSDGLRLWC